MMGHAKQMEAEAEQLAAVQSELERSVASSGAGTLVCCEYLFYLN